MGYRTSLYDEHVALNAKIVDFAGWDMPLHYGSQLDEHNIVRNDAGMFDVSHMTVVDITGPDAQDYLSKLLANNIHRLQQPGKALYSCMLNETAGIIDDLIVFYLDDDFYRMVVNAGTHDKDLAWLEKQSSGFDVDLTEFSDTAMIAVQGPAAREKVHQTLSQTSREAAEKLAPFFGIQCDELFISRTGYTGEDGYEIILPKSKAADLWRSLLNSGIKAAGLGARDTLRLEAGMALYGTDMDDDISPLEAGLSWTVAWEPTDRQFIGRDALEKQRDNGNLKKFIGLILDDRGVLRNHQTLVTEAGQNVGEITSGSFSPVLGKAIAFARVSADVDDHCFAMVRNKQLRASVVKPPFVRNGQACFK